MTASDGHHEPQEHHEHEHPPGQPRRSRAARLFRGVVSFAVLAVLVLAVAGRFGEVHWLLDLASHFPVHYAGLSALLLLLLILQRRWGWAALSLAPLAVAVVSLLPWASLPGRVAAPASSAPDGPRLRLLSANVQYLPDQGAELARVIGMTRPDLLALQEINQEGVDLLAPVQDRLKHVVVVDQDAFGLALFSRHAITRHRIHFDDETAVPTLEARIFTPAGPLTVFVVHPPPPISAYDSAVRDRVLASLEPRLDQIDGPVIVCGDMNATMWSAPLRRLTRETDLINARRSRSLVGTWPAWLPAPMRIPTDHALASADLEILEFETLREIDSDHAPIFVRYALPRTQSAAADQ